MTSAPKPDPGPEVTVVRLDLLMFVLVGTIILTPLSGAVIWFFNWFGAPGFYIVGTMCFAATQLVVGILGIFLLLRGNVTNGKGRKLR
jgi:hypothetical protein